MDAILIVFLLFIFLFFATIIILSAFKEPFDESRPCRSLVKHCIFWFLTYGIYFYVWIYRVTKVLNNVQPTETRNATTEVLLCMFIPSYYIFWIYKTNRLLDKWGKNEGFSEKTTTLCTIISIINAFVSSIIMQDKINNISNHLMIKNIQ